MSFRECKIILGVCLALSFFVKPDGTAFADHLPIEPEEDNSEYYLDLETNAYNRLWREIWDEGDNRFRLRLGSNNVREWFIEEELKFSARLSKRLRFRFNHERLHRYTSDRRTRNRLEFEGNIAHNFFLSLYAEPTFNKTENTIGFMFQSRKAVNNYFFLFIELPHFLRNFTEDHSDPPGDVRTAFDENPIRIGVNARERIYPHVWLRLEVSTTNSFRIRQELVSTGERIGSEQGKVTELDGYLEYVFNPDDSLSRQSAAGIAGAYRHTDKRKGGIASAASQELVYFGAERPFVGVSGVRPDGGLSGVESFVGVSGVVPFAGGAGAEPAVKTASVKTAGGTPYQKFTPFGIEETNPFTPTEEDSVRAWRVENYFARPFAWMVLNDNALVHAAIRFEKGELKWLNENAWETKIKSWNVLPSVGVQYYFGRRKASIVEAAFFAQYRKREESTQTSSGALARSDKKFRDHRIALVYEYRFSPTNSVRIIETIDLNREDWGQFSIHDHGFFQIQIGF